MDCGEIRKYTGEIPNTAQKGGENVAACNAFMGWLNSSFVPDLNAAMPKICYAGGVADLSKYKGDYETAPKPIDQGESVSVGNLFYVSKVDGNTDTPPADSYVTIGWSTNNPYSFNLVPNENADKVSPLLPDYANSATFFIDDLRRYNFHEAGATTGQFAIELPENTFRIAEASRSLPGIIGECKRVLFVGDSLTALNDNSSYTFHLARRFAGLHGGFKQMGYIPFESTVVQAKHQFFHISLTHSGFRDIYNSLDPNDIPYDSMKRKHSPDGKGFTIQGADGSRFITLTMDAPAIAKYSKIKLYYLQEQNGGTFDIHSRGDSNVTSVDTSGSEALMTLDITPTLNGSTSQYDVLIENVTGDVTVYGIYFEDTSVDGFVYDNFSKSGGALWELVQLDYYSLYKYCEAALPDTVFINIGTNDSSQDRTPEEFIADLTTYINRIKNAMSSLGAVTPKFVIITPNNMQYTNFSGNRHAEFEDARRKFARDNNFMYIDTPSEIGNFNHAYLNGWMKDGTHPNAKGQFVIASMIFDKVYPALYVPAKKS